ncbi:MAG TPA: NADH-quinone oxidoreductase subunit C [Ignavibacteria bacterium]|nr:NADH-quinone oxidoreductase subunit C [Ignavibacteria bacterium]HMR40809.1 NADH-quinone oxidoreductase subunit C [Ignavibacteria bacterium]
MTNEDLKQKILTIVPSADFTDPVYEFLNVTILPADLRKLAEQLNSDPDLSFDYMFCLTGVDWVTHMMVVYHLYSTKNDHTVVMKVKIDDRGNPEVETLCDIWKTAEFHEREAYDLFGIKFLNHPDLRRIFLEDDWVGYPMRKDYVDEVNIVEL